MFHGESDHRGFLIYPFVLTIFGLPYQQWQQDPTNIFVEIKKKLQCPSKLPENRYEIKHILKPS